MVELLNLKKLKKEVERADDAYLKLIEDKCMDIFELDEALMKSYELKTKYVRKLEKQLGI